MKQEKLRKLWKTRIANYRASGQSAADWCSASQVTPRQLWYWMRKLKDANELPNGRQWVTMKVDSQSIYTENSLLVRVGPVSIEVKPGFDPSHLFEVVKALQGLC